MKWMMRKRNRHTEHATELITAVCARDLELVKTLLEGLSRNDLAYAAMATAVITKTLIERVAELTGEDFLVVWRKITQEAAQRYAEMDGTDG